MSAQAAVAMQLIRQGQLERLRIGGEAVINQGAARRGGQVANPQVSDEYMEAMRAERAAEERLFAAQDQLALAEAERSAAANNRMAHEIAWWEQLRAALFGGEATSADDSMRAG